MGNVSKLNLVKINRRIDEINKLQDANEKVQATKDLFVNVLKNNDLYVIADPKTTRDEWDNNKIKPYIAIAGENDLYFLRFFTDYNLAKRSARRIDAILDDNTEMVIKVSKEQLISLVKNYFVLGLDGVLLNDGDTWITFNCEAFLQAAFYDVLEMPDHYDASFVNTVRCIYDIAKNKVRISAPVKYYEDIKEEDVFNGKAELFPFGEELLLVEYYDKYKVEPIFKEKVYWLDMTIEKYAKLMKVAEKAGIKNIKSVYRNKEGNGTPGEILKLLNLTGLVKSEEI